MTKSEELVFCLTEYEVDKFLKYLNSRSLGISNAIRKLFIELRNPKKSSKEILYKKATGENTYDEKQLRYLLSELNKQLESFLIVRGIENNKFLEGVLKAETLVSRQCEKAYLYVHNNLNNIEAPHDATYRLRMFEHSEQHLIYSNNKASRKRQPDYSDTFFNLDTFYILKKLQFACEITNMSNILQKKHQLLLIPEIKKLAKESPFKDEVLIKAYDLIHETLINPNNENSFEQARDLLRQNGDSISPGELNELYQYIRNYCIAKINRGNTPYLRTLFNIYNDMLNNNALLNHEFLSQWEYKNIVTISLRIGELDWCINFIKNFINYLKPEERVNALAYNTAYFFFMTSEYNKAIRKLQDVQLNDVFYQLDSRVILLKSYYELNDYDSFFYQTSSFRLFLSRNKNISDNQKIIYRNLIKFLSAIFRAGLSPTKLRRLKDEIHHEKNIADINWLISKVDEALE